MTLKNPIGITPTGERVTVAQAVEDWKLRQGLRCPACNGLLDLHEPRTADSPTPAHFEHARPVAAKCRHRKVVQ